MFGIYYRHNYTLNILYFLSFFGYFWMCCKCSKG